MIDIVSRFSDFSVLERAANEANVFSLLWKSVCVFFLQSENSMIRNDVLNIAVVIIGFVDV